MCYFIRHTTQFRYEKPVRESVMEVRMHPRSESFQRCLSFELSVEPRARILGYRDDAGNNVHHFSIPGTHSELTVTAESVIEMQPPPRLPDRMDSDAWNDLDELIAAGDYLDYLMPSHFVAPTPLLRGLFEELDLSRREDPLSLLRRLNTGIYSAFAYAPATTRANSPIDEALEARSGVCQDFTHIMIALGRELGIPTRYCSGYLYHAQTEHDRSTPGATHAWVESLLPRYGWVGFDPTNDLLAGTRHIRTAVGRDYADVPPTRGVHKGRSVSELKVAVEVTRTNAPRAERVPAATVGWSSGAGSAPYTPAAPATPGFGASSDYDQMPQQQQ